MNMKLEELEEQRKNAKIMDESLSSIKSKDGPSTEYEEIMQKLEGEIRTHIRVALLYRLSSSLNYILTV
jgi:hypothetical protein